MIHADKVKKVVEMIEHEKVSLKQISDEVEMTFYELQPIIQTIVYTDFASFRAGWFDHSESNTEKILEQKDEEILKLKTKLNHTQAILGIAVILSIGLLFV